MVLPWSPALSIQFLLLAVEEAAGRELLEQGAGQEGCADDITVAVTGRECIGASAVHGALDPGLDLGQQGVQSTGQVAVPGVPGVGHILLGAGDILAAEASSAVQVVCQACGLLVLVACEEGEASSVPRWGETCSHICHSQRKTMTSPIQRRSWCSNWSDWKDMSKS